MTLPFLENVFTYEAVLKFLIRQRCKEANDIQKMLVVEDLAVSKSYRPPKTNNNELYGMFPPRRQWVSLGSKNREGLTSKERNEKCLLLTVLREKQKADIHPKWFLSLETRINNIIRGSLSDKHLFTRPNVTVIEKKRDEKNKIIECRPICLFKTLDQRVSASLFNKAFTQLFDSFFYENSLAFRPHKKGEAGMSHLNAVRKIKMFRKVHTGNLWVAECDMKKFYDTLDHDVIKKRFCQLLLWSKQEGKINQEEKKILKNAIYSYVDSFNFYRDVFKYNTKPNHIIWRGIMNSYGYSKQIKWVEKDIIELRKKKWPYRTRNHHKYQLGVPQGGAMSGVIANVVMHFADIKLKKYWIDQQNFLYIRFCDDMTMIGTEKNNIISAFNRYSEIVKFNHLFVHDPEPSISKKMSDFWNGKTRHPYQWGMPTNDIFPWITFVGYDINWMGDTRIRRSSVRKEIKKQYDKKVEIEHLFLSRRERKPRWSKQYILNSLHKRLIGMSVGRVPIWNYKTFQNECSWAKAFTELSDNQWSRAQLKLLDQHRNQMMAQISRKLDNLNYSDIRPSDLSERNSALWYFGKPFSYYGQVLKKW